MSVPSSRKLTSDDVVRIRRMRRDGWRDKPAKEVARDLGISVSFLRQVARRAVRKNG